LGENLQKAGDNLVNIGLTRCKIRNLFVFYRSKKTADFGKKRLKNGSFMGKTERNTRIIRII